MGICFEYWVGLCAGMVLDRMGVERPIHSRADGERVYILLDAPTAKGLLIVPSYLSTRIFSSVDAGTISRRGARKKLRPRQHTKIEAVFCCEWDMPV
jgi:hypothetical protein